jgi:hypothetical protein
MRSVPKPVKVTHGIETVAQVDALIRRAAPTEGQESK